MDPNDRDLIVRTVLGEAGADASPMEQAAIAHVILNRSKMGSAAGYADKIKDVVRQPAAFEAWSHPGAGNYPMRFKKGSDAYENAGRVVDAASSGAIPDPTGGYTHFLEPNEVGRRVQAGQLSQWPSWAREGGMRIGQQVFYPHDKSTVAASERNPATYGTDADPLIQKYFGKEGVPQATPQASERDPAVYGTDADPLIQKYFGKEGAQGGKAKPEPQTGTIQAVPDVRAAAQKAGPGLGRLANFAESFPIVGPAFEAATGRTGSVMEESARLYREMHPGEAMMEGAAGSLVGTGPLMATGLGRAALGMAGPIGARVWGGAAGGGILNSIDAYMRGEPIAPAAGAGALIGGAGPMVGEGSRALTNLVSDYALPRPGPLANINRTGINMLTGAMEGETPGSLAAAQGRIGKAGFTGELSQGLTDLTGGIADTPGPGKGVVREAYRQRAAAQDSRLEVALDAAMGPKIDLPQYRGMIAENRAAAADPLYQQWHSMEVHPTNELKALVPRLEAAGAFTSAEELAGINGKSFNKNYFTTGTTKNYPTPEGWDLAKQGLDRRIDAAYSSGDKRLAKALIGLKGELIDEVGKTPAGQVWNQARGEFADRSSLLDQIDRGHDTFVGGRSGLSADELREELQHLSGPELAARIVGARNAASETIRATTRGDTTLRNTMLASNNKDKLQLMLGGPRAIELIDALESEKNIGEKAKEVVGGSPTAAKSERVKALQPTPLPQYNPSITEPLSFIPPHLRDALRPTTILQGGREAAYADAREQLSHILTQPAHKAGDLLNLLTGETQRRARVSGASAVGSKALTAILGSTGAPALRRRGATPSLDDLLPSGAR